MTPTLKIVPAHAARPCIRPHGNGVVFSVVFHDEKEHGLELIHIPDGETVYFSFTDEFRTGKVYSAYISPFDSGEWMYRYKSGHKYVPDPHAFALEKVIVRGGSYSDDGEEITACSCHPLRMAPLSSGSQYERPLPPTDWNSQVIYGLHVKGLTAAKPGDYPGKGTFAGLSAMIPYLKDLGVTAVELMPVYMPLPDLKKKKPFRTMQEALGAWPVSPNGDPMRDLKERPNYWGFGRGMYYALRKEFGSQQDFLQMVRDFHRAGLRVVLQIFFEKGIGVPDQIELLRFYINRFGIDGFRLMGHVPSPSAIAMAPSLSDIALFYHSFPFEEMAEEAGSARALYEDEIDSLLPSKAEEEEEALPAQNGRPMPPRPARAAIRDDRIRFDHLITCSDEFQNLLRRFVKSDDYVLKDFLKLFLNVPEGHGDLRYAASFDGFTLADVVSYNERHNDANGEFGLDGRPDNYSWNCGEEGDTDDPKVLALRRKQVRNFLTLVMLSRGTPMLLMGDERYNSQKGNNNPYCQDNAISWLDWEQTPDRRSLTAFVSRLAAFRAEHPVFRGGRPFQYIDYMGIGHPDVSLHGAEAWKPDLGAFSHSIGLSYCENYAVAAKMDRLKKDTQLSFVYVALNMYWKELSLALPKLPPHYVWKVFLDTETEEGFLGKLITPADQHCVTVAPRSVRLLRAVLDPASILLEKKQESMEKLPPVGAVLKECRREKVYAKKRGALRRKGAGQTPLRIRRLMKPMMRPSRRG